MVKAPVDLRYTDTHEWVREAADGTLEVGITDFAQDALGDIVYVECPAPGRQVTAGEAVGVIESVKATSDLYAPVSGEIVAVNGAIPDHCEAINADAFGAWLYRLKPSSPGETARLLDAAAYVRSVEAAR